VGGRRDAGLLMGYAETVVGCVVPPQRER